MPHDEGFSNEYYCMAQQANLRQYQIACTACPIMDTPHPHPPWGGTPVPVATSMLVTTASAGHQPVRLFLARVKKTMASVARARSALVSSMRSLRSSQLVHARPAAQSLVAADLNRTRYQSSAAAGAVSRAKGPRPMSPHLTIYKFGINMITSTIFRGTGIFLFVGKTDVDVVAIQSLASVCCAAIPEAIPALHVPNI